MAHSSCHWKRRTVVAVAAAALFCAIPTSRVDGQSYRNRSVGEWSEALQSEDVRERWYATLALAQIGPEARVAISPLMDLLAERSQYEYVRAGAALALGKIHEDADRVVPLLADTLESELPSVRRHSARALGCFGAGAESAVPKMLLQLGRDDTIFRIDVAEALWLVARHERAMPFLIEQVRAGRTPGSFEAAEALGRLAPDSVDAAVPALAKALGSANGDVARSAARSLGRAGPAAAAELAKAARDEQADVRRGVAEAYAWMGPAGASGLIGALSDTSPDVRRAAARGLGRIGPEVAAVEPALLRAVNDSDPRVRATAATALKRIAALSIL
jgi:HEAT repeat protein